MRVDAVNMFGSQGDRSRLRLSGARKCGVAFPISHSLVDGRSLGQSALADHSFRGSILQVNACVYAHSHFALQRTHWHTARRSQDTLTTDLLNWSYRGSDKDGSQEEEGDEALVLVRNPLPSPVPTLSGGELEMVLEVLQPGVRGREDAVPAPEGQALQVPRLPQEALHRPRPRHPLHAGPQGDHREGPVPLPPPAVPLPGLGQDWARADGRRDWCRSPTPCRRGTRRRSRSTGWRASRPRTSRPGSTARRAAKSPTRRSSRPT